MAAKDALKDEIVNRQKQLTELRSALEIREERGDLDAKQALALLRRAEMAFAGAEAKTEQSIWEDGIYLYSQGCWNLGYAYGISRQSCE